MYTIVLKAIISIKYEVLKGKCIICGQSQADPVWLSPLSSASVMWRIINYNLQLTSGIEVYTVSVYLKNAVSTCKAIII